MTSPATATKNCGKPAHPSPTRGRFRLLLPLLAASLPAAASAQISLASAIDLALKINPRVLAAQADVARTQAIVDQTKDVYIPTVSVGFGYGKSYGYLGGQPSIVTLTTQSLVYSPSQRNYIRAAKDGVSAARMNLLDARESVAEEVALAYVAVDRDSKRSRTLDEQLEYATRLVHIVEDRVSGGRDTGLDLTSARLAAAQIRLAKLRSEDEASYDRERLARLLDLPARVLSVDEQIPPIPIIEDQPYSRPMMPLVQAAYANARAKHEIAMGDSRYLYRPQLGFSGEYARYAKYNGSDVYLLRFQHNNAGVGVQVVIPFFDRGHQAKARETAAEAARTLHEADNARDLVTDGQAKLFHNVAELRARSEVAELDQQLAQQQLEAVRLQMTQAPSGTTVLITPRDEQNSHIAEREKFLTRVESEFQLRTAQISLLRQTGGLGRWLQMAIDAIPANVPNLTPADSAATPPVGSATARK